MMVTTRSGPKNPTPVCQLRSSIDTYTSLTQATPSKWTPAPCSSSPSHGGSSFLSLPRELRDIIYNYLHEPDDTEFVSLVMPLYDEDDGAARCSYAKGRSKLPGVALQRSCRQLYQECLPILYGKATFYLNPRNKYHCAHCRVQEVWSHTLNSLAAAPPFYVGFVTKVLMWASHTEDPNSGLIDDMYGMGASVDEYHEWFWPYAISMCKDLCRLFPHLQVARLIPDDAKMALFACMRQLEGYKHERVALATRTASDEAPRYFHRIHLERESFEGHQCRQHPALFAFQRLREYIGAAMPEIGLPKVLHVLQDFWPEGPHLEQWQYHEHVFNEFLKILARPPETSSSEDQITQALEGADFSMTFACHSLKENSTEQDLNARRLVNDTCSYDADRERIVGSESSPGLAAKIEGTCELCGTPEMARHMWWKKGLIESWA